MARELGATATINASDPHCIERVRDLTKGGVDYGFEMAGSSPALELAWNITRRGGQTITAGLPHPDKVLSISPAKLVAEERVLRGSYLGSCVPLRDIPTYIDLYQAGKLPVDQLVTDRISLEDINAAFDDLSSGAAVRQIISFAD